MRVWRVCPAEECEHAFEPTDDEGRWNPAGLRLVYTSESRSLATVEYVVHLDDGAPERLVAVSAEVPGDVPTASVPPEELPADWRDPGGSDALREIGSRWAAEGRTAVLRVPSAVVPGDVNVLLNPAHPDFARVRVLDPEPFRLDPRLARRGETPPAGLQTLDPRSITVGRLGGAIGAAILSLLALVAAVVLTVVASPRGALVAAMVLGWVVLTGLLVWSALAWPVLEHRHTRYRVDAQGLEIRRGVVWREVVSVPRSRVQHTDVSQGPIQRSFGLSTLVVHTAGSEHASVHLAGLAAPVAARIRDHLLAGTGVDAV